MGALRFILFLTAITLNSSGAFAQTDTLDKQAPWHAKVTTGKETAIKLLLGGHLQQARSESGKEYSRKYFEIGLHGTLTLNNSRHPAGILTQGFSVEVAPEKKTIVGFKYGGWVEAALFVLGINAIYYTDFEHGNFKIRPELGFGAYPFKLTIGYNIPTVANADFKKLQRSGFQLSLDLLLKLKTLKTIPTEYPVPKRP